MPPERFPGLDIRPAKTEDEAQVLDLLAASLGWGGDQLHRDYFRWKHHDNPFGPSAMWVAASGTSIVGFRSFLRWELVTGDGSVLPVVRAVDTATHPLHQGRGVFSRLTAHGVEELRRQSVAVIFNTPNDKSRPGYLKMGWRPLGRIELGARPTSLRSVGRLIGARAPATKWSEPTTVGEPAADVFADRPAAAALLERVPFMAALATRRHGSFLAWRYGFAPLGYRVLCAGAALSDGICVFRLRRRGSAMEVAVVEVLVPDGRSRRLLFDQMAAAGIGDYLLATRRSAPLATRCLPVPGQGPILMARALDEAQVPDLRAWDLSLGDVELL